MPTRTALDVLTLDDARAELQVEVLLDGTSAFDARITQEIGAAVDLVSRETGRDLLTVDVVPPSLRMAVVCGTREFYNGATEIGARSAVYALIRPWRRLARGET